MKNKFLLLLALLPLAVFGQTFPTNGVNDKPVTRYTFINANIYVSADVFVSGGTLETEDGKIKAVKKEGEKYDTTAIIIDVKGQYIYPSFIDIYSSYGMPEVSKKANPPGPQFLSSKKGPYGWNEAIKPETDAAQLFTNDSKTADELRSLGFGTVASFVHDGISRGTSVVVNLSEERENLCVVKKDAAANFSFKKGSSTQDYPSSLIGSVALLRQTFYDALAYKRGAEETNLSLDAWNRQLENPLVFEASNKWDIFRVQKIAKEFGKDFIIKTNGDEYQVISQLKSSNPKFIVPLNFPPPLDIKSVFDEANIRYEDMKHRDMAPFNGFILQQNNIPFAFTLEGLKNKKDFLENLRKALSCGLDEKTALNALTIIPARFLKADQLVGTLEKGKQANFIIVSDKLFKKEAIITENWVGGKKFTISTLPTYDWWGNYDLYINEKKQGRLGIGIKNGKHDFVTHDSSVKVIKNNYSAEKENINATVKTKFGRYNLSGWVKYSGYLEGVGTDSLGNKISWYLEDKDQSDSASSEKPKVIKPLPSYAVGQPYVYANKSQTSYFIRNVTVWTNTDKGVIKNTNVLVSGGKIQGVGDIAASLITDKTITVDGTGKHLTPGIIDEHSHIAVSGSVNEGTQSVTSEVRIEDAINPEDINIYRQLAGGVTTSQLLHGSANAIGGQSAVIKLKWGTTPDSLLFPGVTPRIKFALGENVKQSNWGEAQTVRFPQTRMGVQQVFEDAFTRALEYERAWADFRSGKNKKEPRKDLELDAVLEVIRGKRLVTCHSYIQSEINMLIKVAEKYGFKINIFTHVLEGYKVADKIKAHGAGASSFSDWWGYKYEVIDAIPYNAALLYKMGVTTCINSDDAEMGRRLNQEAAKTIKYGGVPEEEALKMITLNPAKLMGIDKRVGSIAPGMDADLVLWSGHPLSVYSKPLKTFIEGVVYFDSAEHQKAEQQLLAEKQVLLNKMREGVAEGKGAETPKKQKEILNDCEDMENHEGEDDEQ